MCSVRRGGSVGLSGILRRDYIARVAELDTPLERAKLENFTITNDNRLLTALANELLVKAEWIPTSRLPGSRVPARLNRPLHQQPPRTWLSPGALVEAASPSGVAPSAQFLRLVRPLASAGRVGQGFFTLPVFADSYPASKEPVCCTQYCCAFLSRILKEPMQWKLRLDQRPRVFAIDAAQESHHLLQAGNLEVNMLQFVPHRPGGVKQLETY